MKLRDDEIRKIYYKIGEVAKILGENTSTIRFWAKQLKMDIRITGGIGFHTHRWQLVERDIQELNAVHYLLRKEKFTFKGAVDKIELWRKGEYKIPKIELGTIGTLVIPPRGDEVDSSTHDNESTNTNPCQD